MTKRKLAFVLALPLAVATAFAQQPPNPEPPGGSNPPPPAEQGPPSQEAPAQAAPAAAPAETAAEPETTGTKEVAAEVVSSDADAKSIRVKVMIKKDASSEPELKEAAIAVDSEAVPNLNTVNPGDKVKLLCRMNGTKVVAVKDIKIEKTDQPAKSDKPPQP
jgi:hypothetical protein